MLTQYDLHHQKTQVNSMFNLNFLSLIRKVGALLLNVLNIIFSVYSSVDILC